MKNLAKQRQYCEASIARTYSEHEKGSARFSIPPPISLDTRCLHTRSSKNYTDDSDTVTSALRSVLRQHYHAAEIDIRLCMVHKRATICSVPFTSGERIGGVKRSGAKMLRCGSVCTLVRGGRSLYAWIVRFMSFDRIHMAHVKWLPIPEYPLGTPVLVKLVRHNPIPDEPCILFLNDIDPSQVCITHEPTCMYVTRMSGLDKMP